MYARVGCYVCYFIGVTGVTFTGVTGVPGAGESPGGRTSSPPPSALSERGGRRCRQSRPARTRYPPSSTPSGARA
eukprot:1186888-Prorocentrum_minimum.AAC.2